MVGCVRVYPVWMISVCTHTPLVGERRYRRMRSSAPAIVKCALLVKRVRPFLVVAVQVRSMHRITGDTYSA
jgi:hypothetical protein